jgi:hypothetical protein
MTLSSSKANSSEFCTTADPESFKQVFDCVSTADINGLGNPFINIGKMMCGQLKATYQLVQRAHMKERKEVRQSPNCKTFAQVIEEFDGEPPYWKACLDYDGTNEHAVNCLRKFTEQNPRGKIANYNCQAINIGYQFILKMVSDRQNQLPENYMEFDCNRAKQIYVSLTGETKGTECSGYTSNSAPEHLKKCISPTDDLLAPFRGKLTCPILRNLYQKKLKMAYGAMPADFRMLPCSQMKSYIEELNLLVN